MVSAIQIDGFNFHAGAALAASDRQALELLLRYQLRPPLSKVRLTRLDDGRIKLRLRTPYQDGTVVAYGRAGAERRPTPDLPLLDVEIFNEEQER